MASFNETSTAEDVTEGLDLSGRTYLVTGCNSGLGLETMRVLALRGARVVGAARTKAKATAACETIDGDTLALACELSDPASVRATVDAVHEPLHGIIANAGVMALPELVLQHGVEAQMFTNHVGHFMLITGLLDRLASKGRVVMVSSGAHSYARGKDITFENLAWEREYKPWPAYGQSKLANILFAKELAKRLPKGQTANALHPGLIETSLWRHLSKEETGRMTGSLSFRSIAQGAATQVFVATHSTAGGVNGMYFGDCAPRKPTALARDKTLATRLWQSTEALVSGL